MRRSPRPACTSPADRLPPAHRPRPVLARPPAPPLDTPPAAHRASGRCAAPPGRSARRRRARAARARRPRPARGIRRARRARHCARSGRARRNTPERPPAPRRSPRPRRREAPAATPSPHLTALDQAGSCSIAQINGEKLWPEALGEHQSRPYAQSMSKLERYANLTAVVLPFVAFIAAIYFLWNDWVGATDLA